MKSGNEADRCRNPESYDRKDKNRRYRKIRERSASCKKGLIFVSKRKTDETFQKEIRSNECKAVQNSRKAG